MPYILLGLIALGLIGYLFFRPVKKPAAGEYFISTQGQSAERVKSLDLDSASEDASYILDEKKLSFPRTNKETGDIEYKPDLEKDWVINIKTKEPILFTTDQLFKIFDKDWRYNFIDATIYKYSAKEKKWTYTITNDEPEVYSRIQVAIDLVEIYDEANAGFDTKKLEKYIAEIKRKLNAFPAELEFEGTIEQAAARGKQLAAFKDEFDIEAVILLKSEKAFNGKLAWDALQSVGLVWGDGDLFHWNNEEHYGDDQHFSVWTRTEPGYFMPEDIRDGFMNPKDLGFSFSVPRSADPKNVFAVMLNAVKYCQKRLGGVITDNDGKAFNEAKEKKFIDDLVEKMKRKGLIPGSDRALRIF